MKKVEINGIAKIEAYRNGSGNYSTTTINGVSLEKLLANELLEKGASAYDDRKASLCKISITIEKHNEALTINGEEMPLEL
ncbi:MAG: hypothetical protein HQP61_02390 [Peptococcaceae bacterium]|nr:hypothetical protein [Candidatus Syntrophopropionicum ammoniitolerans]